MLRVTLGNRFFDLPEALTEEQKLGVFMAAYSNDIEIVERIVYNENEEFFRLNILNIIRPYAKLYELIDVFNAREEPWLEWVQWQSRVHQNPITSRYTVALKRYLLEDIGVLIFQFDSLETLQGIISLYNSIGMNSDDEILAIYDGNTLMTISQ